VGWADHPLSPRGEEMARRAAGSPELDGIEIVVSSDLRRASRTAELLVAGCRSVRLPPAVYPELRERRLGAAEGLTTAQAKAMLAGRSRTEIGAEPGRAFRSRVEAGWRRIADDHPGRRVLAVCHSGVARAIEHSITGCKPDRLPILSGVWVAVVDGELRYDRRTALLDPHVLDATRDGNVASVS